MIIGLILRGIGLKHEADNTFRYCDDSGKPVRFGYLLFFSVSTGLPIHHPHILDKKGGSKYPPDLKITEPTRIELYDRHNTILWTREVEPT